MTRDRESIGAIIVPGKRTITVKPGETVDFDLLRTSSVGIQTGATIAGASYLVSADGNTFVAGAALSPNAIVKVDVSHLRALRIITASTDSPVTVLKSTMV